MRATLVLTCAVLAGCDREPKGCEDTLASARRDGFPYKAVWRAAADGDEAPLARLLGYSRKVDGGAAYGHGIALLDLSERIGDARMARGISLLPPDLRRQMASFLQCGVEYGGRGHPDLTSRLYPLSWAASSSSP